MSDSSDDGVTFRKKLNTKRKMDKELLIPMTVALPITTRGIGIGITYFYYKAEKYFNNFPDPPSIYSVFRISLALIESKLRFIQSTKGSPAMIGEIAYRFDKSLGEKDFDVTSFPAPILRILKAIGEVVYNQVTYTPVMMVNSYTPGRKLIPRPENLIISNLRETVTALADPDISIAFRKQFFECNSIPGAIWDDDFLLKNADEIMPANYSFQSDLDNEVAEISSYCSKLQKYLPYLIYTFKQRYLRERGKLASFVSNEQMGKRVKNLFIPNRQNKTMKNYYKTTYPVGQIETYLVNNGKLNNADRLEGQVYLLGEVPMVETLMYPFYCWRNARSMTQEMPGPDYYKILELLYSSSF